MAYKTIIIALLSVLYKIKKKKIYLEIKERLESEQGVKSRPENSEN
jgi:hypothetical protein